MLSAITFWPSGRFCHRVRVLRRPKWIGLVSYLDRTCCTKARGRLVLHGRPSLLPGQNRMALSSYLDAVADASTLAGSSAVMGAESALSVGLTWGGLRWPRSAPSACRLAI